MSASFRLKSTHKLLASHHERRDSRRDEGRRLGDLLDLVGLGEDVADPEWALLPVGQHGASQPGFPNQIEVGHLLSSQAWVEA